MTSAQNPKKQGNDEKENRSLTTQTPQCSKPEVSLSTSSFVFMDVNDGSCNHVKLLDETNLPETNADVNPGHMGSRKDYKEKINDGMASRSSATQIPQSSHSDLSLSPFNYIVDSELCDHSRPPHIQDNMLVREKVSTEINADVKHEQMDSAEKLCDCPRSLHLQDVRLLDETASPKTNAVVRHDQLASPENSKEQQENGASATQTPQYSMSNLSLNSSTIRHVDVDGNFSNHSSFSQVKYDRLQHEKVSSEAIGEAECKQMDGAEDSEEKSSSESRNRSSATKTPQKSEPDLFYPSSLMFMDVDGELSDHSSVQLLQDFKLLHKTVLCETNADMKCDQIGSPEDSMEQRNDEIKNSSSVTESDQHLMSGVHLNLPFLNCMDVDTELFDHSSPSHIQDAKLLDETVSPESLAYVKYDHIATLENSKELTNDELTNMSTVPRGPQFSKADMDLDGKVCDGRSSPHVQDVKLLPATISPETIDDVKYVQMGSAQDSKEQTNDEATNTSPLSESPQLLKPDFSLLEGEICLDKFSIRQLQEAFWAAFGRQTAIKDKLWLKRRIAMGLTNSCIIPNTHFIIKDKKIVQENIGEEACMLKHTCDLEARSVLSDKTSFPVTGNCGEPLDSTTQRVESQDVPSCEIQVPFTFKYDEPQMEPLTSKRVRKPTRRYIEELSEMEDKEISEKPLSVKSHEPGGDDCCDANLVTRHNFLGGIQIPRVCRLRRGRRRTDFTLVLKTIHADLQRRNRGIHDNEEGQCSLICENSSNDNIQGVPFRKNDMGNTVLNIYNSADRANNLQEMINDSRRKQHRAWTLDEVLKLVEGVALYGAGRWSEIRRMVFESSSRSPVDLKDKWRNLLRASFTHGSNDNMPRNFGKNTSIPIPTDILLRVRELAELHSQVPRGCGQKEFPATSRITKEKRASFL